MDQLFVISQTELVRFGCPHCGGKDGGEYLSFGTCCIWGCEDCKCECAVVESSVKEVFRIEVRNTDVQDLIGNHPYSGFNTQIFDVGLSLRSPTAPNLKALN